VQVDKSKRSYKIKKSKPALGGDGGTGFTASFFLAITGELLGDLPEGGEGLADFSTLVLI
jgi:hypothetical protein